ncbi:MAG: nicotinate (nicotinamide) nucleotide adenylyltransferase [Oscillospiraceae bacterium]|jgi:nicotinate-nucleotide adenylyltransferase|nr:nicotinate (nicotinamide) nucleotide adenylyltransferase [Oscillospiraceae bacterium]
MFKIGIFGGSFNPPHNGHISIAVQAKEQLGLDKMLIMPTGTSPHKGQAALGFYAREYMCRLAFGKLPGFEVTDIEGKIAGRSYTINSLRLLKKQYPANVEFFLLIGADMLFYFNQWHKYETIMQECNVVAAAREQGQFSDMTEYATEIGRIKVLNLEVTEVSSSEVREKITKGEDVSNLVPPGVLKIIKEKKYYL